MAKDVAQLIKEATEAVKGVPEDLRSVAFSKAYDTLAGALGNGGAQSSPPASNGRRSTSGGKRQTATATSSADTTRSQLDRLDRTSYPEITHNATALANSLRVLRAARDELKIDGLSAPDIAHVLTGKFRCQVKQNAVSMALNRATKQVNRHKEGNEVIFRIMAGGETFLNDIDAGNGTAPAKPSKKKPARKPEATKKTTSSTSSSDGASNKKPSKTNGAKKSSSRPGPKAALHKLIDNGYFATPRGISDIIEHLRHSTGHKYKPTDISPTLLRLLREAALVRVQNSDNQYEYKDA